MSYFCTRKETVDQVITK